MTTNDPTLLAANQLSLEIVANRLSPVDVTEAYLERIRTSDAKLHAFAEVYAEEARQAAKAAHLAIRAGHAAGPLHGIPIALKDLIEIEGKTVTGGSQAWRQRQASRTATLARRLLAQGMIILGKTHTVEFAMGGWGTNSHLGTPWNPWDLERQRTAFGQAALSKSSDLVGGFSRSSRPYRSKFRWRRVAAPLTWNFSVIPPFQN